MPPRKSTSSLDNDDADIGGGGPTQMTEQQLKAQSEGISVEDLLLPRSVTQRLAKSVLPPNTTIQKDALLAIQKAATVFVSYLSSHANEATLKRIIAPSDVLSALSELEFDSLRPRLERELDAHTEAQAEKKRAKEKKASTPADVNNNNSKNINRKDGDDGAAAAAAAVSIAAAEVGEKKNGDETKKKEKITPIKGNKRVKRDSNGDETEVEEPDEDETEEEEQEEEDDDDEEEDDDDDSDVGEGNEDDEDETRYAEDLDRVEDLDARIKGQEDESGSEEDEDDDDGPAAQLRSNMGLG